MGWLWLLLAVVFEVIGTSALKASDNFKHLGAAGLFILFYGLCFYFLSLAMKTIPLNVAYAVWAGLGIVLTTVVAVVYWHEGVSFSSLVGIGLILGGAIILQLSA